MKISEEIKKLVKEACKRESNHFGYGIWEHHILLVVKNAKLLADRLSADKEVVELSALLHDYSSVVSVGLHPEHHIHSARLAEEILGEFSYPEEKIEEIKNCILAHRASKDIHRETVESQILASADAMAHFQSVGSLLHLAFVRRNLGIEDGIKWVLDKLGRSWTKMMPEAKEIVSEKYESIKIVFGSSDRRFRRF